MSPQAQGLLIHLGYMRTGSSFLQTQVFCNADFGFSTPYSRAQFQPHIVEPYALDFDRQRCRSSLALGLSAAHEQGLVPVISDEGFAGNWGVHNGYDAPEIAQRLNSAFPEARYLLIIREQRSHVQSLYSRMIQVGGWCSFEKFLFSKNYWPFFDPRFLESHRLIKFYQSLVGSKRLLVLPYELLTRSPQDYVEQIIKFSGATNNVEQVKLPVVNKSWSALALRLMRIANPIFSQRADNALGSLFSKKFYNEYAGLVNKIDKRILSRISNNAEARLKKKISDITGDFYADSNRRTAELIDIDLEALGYST